MPPPLVIKICFIALFCFIFCPDSSIAQLDVEISTIEQYPPPCNSEELITFTIDYEINEEGIYYFTVDLLDDSGIGESRIIIVDAGEFDDVRSNSEQMYTSNLWYDVGDTGSLTFTGYMSKNSKTSNSHEVLVFDNKDDQIGWGSILLIYRWSPK